MDNGVEVSVLPGAKHADDVPLRNSYRSLDDLSEPQKSINKIKRKRKPLDGTDFIILRELSKDATIPASDLVKILKKQRIVMTERGIRKRIISLKKHGIIRGYTIITDDDVSGKSFRRIALVRFNNTKNLIKRLDDYKKYVNNSPYCLFAVKVRGDLDWLQYKCFPSKGLADQEDDVFRSSFGDIMAEYKTYDAEVMKDNFNAIVEVDEVVAYLKKFI